MSYPAEQAILWETAYLTTYIVKLMELLPEIAAFGVVTNHPIAGIWHCYLFVLSTSSMMYQPL